jgi:serine/threonine-protein kinase
MRAAPLIACLLLLSAQAADARHYHFHWYHWGQVRARPAPSLDRGTLRESRSERAYTRVLGRPFPPPDWQLQPADPKRKGRRYLAPDGHASLTFYASPADQAIESAHLKSVAFADGEQMLTLAGNRDELLVTGTKGDRMFVRKARLACAGQEWHHVALEFPADARNGYALVVAQAVRALDLVDGDGCTAPVAGSNSDGAESRPLEQLPPASPPSGQAIR